MGGLRRFQLVIDPVYARQLFQPGVQGVAVRARRQCAAQQYNALGDLDAYVVGSGAKRGLLPQDGADFTSDCVVFGDRRRGRRRLRRAIGTFRAGPRRAVCHRSGDGWHLGVAAGESNREEAKPE